LELYHTRFELLLVGIIQEQFLSHFSTSAFQHVSTSAFWIVLVSRTFIDYSSSFVLSECAISGQLY
jgi:hypothetical protein